MERLTCACPGCRRTIARWRLRVPSDTEWVCQKHWRAVPKHLRKRYSRIKRRWNKHQEPKAGRLAVLLWRQCRDRAIAEAFMGVEP